MPSIEELREKIHTMQRNQTQSQTETQTPETQTETAAYVTVSHGVASLSHPTNHTQQAAASSNNNRRGNAQQRALSAGCNAAGLDAKGRNTMRRPAVDFVVPPNSTVPPLSLGPASTVHPKPPPQLPSHTSRQVHSIMTSEATISEVQTHGIQLRHEQHDRLCT